MRFKKNPKFLNRCGGFAPIIAIIIVAAILIGGGVWYYRTKNYVEPPASLAIHQNQSSTQAASSSNKLPPEKQAIEDQYAKERAEGLMNPAPKTIQLPSSKTILLGKEFTLERSEVVRIENTNFYVRLDVTSENQSRFIPEFTDDLGLFYSLDEVPYDITVKDTDYKTYAKLVVNSAEVECATKIGTALDQCWDGLGRRLTDQTYCFRIKDQGIKDGCFEYIAANSNDSEMCKNVVLPKLYCQLYSSSTWQTVHSSLLGLSFRYPSGLFSTSVESSGSLGASLSPNYSGQELSGIYIQIVPFSTEFDFADGSYKLRYDSNNNQWTKMDFLDDAATYKPSCEDVSLLGGTQKIPAYNVSYKYSAEYVVILKQGLLLISEDPVEEPIPPYASVPFDKMVGSITFDHPELVIQPKCP